MFSDRSYPVRLAGRYVATAAEYTASTGDALGTVIDVHDLRTGDLVRRFASLGAPNTYDVTDLELRSDGSLPWIARIFQGVPATTSYRGQGVPTTDSQSAIADPGPGTDPRSLALSRTTLYWTHDDASRFTKLR